MKNIPANSFHPDLVNLLTQYAHDLRDKTTALVAADMADELDLPNTAWVLRELGDPTCDYQLLFTGSRKYGTPTSTSDFDLVMWIPAAARQPFEDRTDYNDRTEYHLMYPTRRRGRTISFTIGEPGISVIEHSPPGIDAALRFGPLNLLCVHLTPQWLAWEEGTKILMKESPVPRHRAVSVFTEQRQKYLDHLLDQYTD